MDKFFDCLKVRAVGDGQILLEGAFDTYHSFDYMDEGDLPVYLKTLWNDPKVQKFIGAETLYLRVEDFYGDESYTLFRTEGEAQGGKPLETTVIEVAIGRTNSGGVLM